MEPTRVKGAARSMAYIPPITVAVARPEKALNSPRESKRTSLAKT